MFSELMVIERDTFIEICKVLVLVILLFIWATSSKSNENTKMKNLFYKWIYYFESFMFLIFSKDTKGLGYKNITDPDMLLNCEKSRITTKTIIFLRHGESEWNDIFNKGIGIGMLTRFIGACFRELSLLISMDSSFLDSGLNHEGYTQAQELARFLQKATPSDSMSADQQLLAEIQSNQSSVIAVSNLRRAISTTTVALYPRLQKTKEKILILSSLQEISRNVDTYALSRAKGIPDVSHIAEFVGDKEFLAENVIDATENMGNKSKAFNGKMRLKAFNDWAFKRDESVIIVGGHSLWFRTYFQTYMPFKSTHQAKSMKMENSGMVSFTLQRADVEGSSGPLYRVDPETLKPLYLGFTKK